MLPGILEMRLIFLLVCTGFAFVDCEEFLDGVVEIKCGTLEDNIVELSYFGESLQVSAFMGDGTVCRFKQNIATATWTLTVALSGRDENRCVMKKVRSRQIYSIEVVSFRRSPDFQSQDDEKYLMECNFETYQEQEETSLPLIEDTLETHHIVANHEGRQSTSNYSISTVRMDGAPLTSVEIGSLVRLKVTMSPSDEERGLGFMPVKCDVMTPDRQQSAVVLVNGCGTGYPFELNQGFHMGDAFGMSPTFRMFRLNPKKGIAFTCTFVTCNGDCLGSTCEAERLSGTETRIKREVLSGPSKLHKSITSSTGTKEILDNQNDQNNVATTSDILNDKQIRSTFTVSKKSTKLFPGPIQPLAMSADGRGQLLGQPILLIGQIDAQSFMRTVKVAVLGTSALVLLLFVAMTLVFLIKFRDIR